MILLVIGVSALLGRVRELSDRVDEISVGPLRSTWTPPAPHVESLAAAQALQPPYIALFVSHDCLACVRLLDTLRNRLSKRATRYPFVVVGNGAGATHKLEGVEGIQTVEDQELSDLFGVVAFPWIVGVDADYRIVASEGAGEPPNALKLIDALGRRFEKRDLAEHSTRKTEVRDGS